MRSILVTGGAGFIGSHFVEHILTAHPDYRVVVLDKLTYAGKRSNLWNAEALAGDRLTFVQGDVGDIETDCQLLQACDLVVHFASESHVVNSTKDPLLFARNNMNGTALLLEAARLQRVKRFLLISTVEVYGSCHRQVAASREDDLPRPSTPYAAAKVAAESWGMAYWESFGFPVVITRSCNNYGPRQHEEKQLPDLMSMALRDEPLRVQGDGKHLRQWLYVTDHCRALDALLHADERQVAGEIFNIGGGAAAERTTIQNAQAILERLNKHPAIIHGPDRVPSLRRLALDSSKLEQRLGWRPQVRFEEGLDRTLAFYKREHQMREQQPAYHATDDRSRLVTQAS
ncbi:MAG TPA: GDP-mannose 4,6-dehydratase [Ktedonobacterales bacterium]|nr:GDP-mannose 4,6-dehydratase [Ktedonobacterales bacterium]